MNKLIGLGAGGHAKVIIDILRLRKEYDIIGMLDSQEKLWGKEIIGIPVLGGDELLPELYSKGIRLVFIGVGSAGDNQPRTLLYHKAFEYGFQVINAIHPNSLVSISAKVGQGSTIMAGAIINADAILGNNVIINTGAIVEHDCLINDHVHIATGAKLGGNVIIGPGTQIGLGASVRQSVKIGAYSIVGTGAVVVKDVPDYVIVAGVPAKILRAVNK